MNLLHSPAWKLFLPSWNFFADVDSFPSLEWRWRNRAGLAMPWLPVFSHAKVHWIRRVFFNSTGNLELLERSLLDRAVCEFEEHGIGEVPSPKASEWIDLLSTITRRRILASAGPFENGAEFQFRFGHESRTMHESAWMPCTVESSG